MAGDWIKMRGNLWDDPRIGGLCDTTGQPEAMVIGALYWLWATADQHSENGAMPGLTLRQIDRKTGLQGFGASLCAIGWLEESAEGVRIVKFEEHNGASAKKRCQTAKRVANFKAGSAQETQGSDSGNAQSVSGALPREREEKRREETTPKKEEKLPAPPPRGVEAAPPPPFDGKNFEILNGKSVVAIAVGFDLPEAWGIDAESLGWKPNEVLRESEKFRQYWTAGKGQGTRRSVKGWRQAWSNWLEKAARDKR